MNQEYSLKYVSIDLETLGTDHEKDSVIQISAVIDDLSNLKPISELPKFNIYISHPVYTSTSAFAMDLNKRIYSILSNHGKDVVFADRVAESFYHFINDNHGHYDRDGLKIKILPAGKNFAGFDKLFLNRLPSFEYYIQFSHRVLDPGSMYVTPYDAIIPDIKECMKRSGLDFSNMTLHNALDDATIVVKLIRKKLLNLPTNSEFL